MPYGNQYTMGPKLSIVVPVLNGARFIDRAVRYIEEQTFKDYEVILVADARSTDDTVAVAKKHDGNIRIIVKKTPGALGMSRNIGVDESDGEFIWFMDVDDRPLPTMLEKMIHIQEKYDADVVACNFVYSSNLSQDFDFSGYRFDTRVMDSDTAILERAKERFPVTAWSKIYRKSMLVENGIRFEDRFCEDIEYTYKTLRCSKTVCYCEEPLYVYYQHPSSYCKNNSASDDRGRSEITAYNKLDDFFDTEPVEGFGRYSALVRIRSSGHMSYKGFMEYARSEECKDMLKKNCSDPLVYETVWYRMSPTTYYLAERAFFKLIYYRDGRIFTGPGGLHRTLRSDNTSDAYVPSIPSGSRDTLPITIGICAYNEEKNIERTIRTIFTQELTGCSISDVFVVSSGSTDSTDSIVEGLSKEYPVLTLLPQKKREGKNSAVNLILDNKRTEIVVLLNADNVFENKDSLEKLIEPLHDPRVGMVGGHPIPTNSDRTVTGYTVQLLWRMHHHVAMQSPKTGELIAFRDVGTRLPTDMQSDEDILRMKLEEKGFETVYAPGATILNHGPDTVRDYIKQRTRVNIGERYLKSKFEYGLPTHDYRKLINAFMDSIREMRYAPFKTICAVFLELYPRLKARVHVSADKGDMCVWDQVATTKKL